MASFTAALKQWVIDTYQTKMGADDNYVTDAEKAALHSHANKTALDAVSGTNTGDEPDASTTVAGIVELATTTEATTGTDTTRAVTPAGVKAALDAKAASDMSTYAGVTDRESIWIPPAQLALAESQPTTLAGHVALWDGLMGDHPDYITRETLGMDESGTYPIYRYTFEPETPERTIVLTANIHGGEEIGQHILYRFMRHVADDFMDYPQLAYLRTRTRIVTIPLANPYGIVAGNRTNGNPVARVDINRNFTYGWADYVPTSEWTYKGTAALSEVESQYIDQTLAAYPDAICYLDIHNTSTMTPPAGTATYYANVPYGSETSINTIHQIIDLITPTGLTAVRKLEWGAIPSSANHAAMIYGSHAASIEHQPGSVDGHVAGSADDMTDGMLWIGNLILQYASLHPATLTHNTQPRAWEIADNNTTFSSTGTGWQDVPDASLTITPGVGAIVEATASYTFQNGTADSQNFFALVVTQVGHDTLGPANITTELLKNEVYVEPGGKRDTVTLSRRVGVFGADGGHGAVVIKLMAKATTGTILGRRMRLSVLLTPSDTGQRYTRVWMGTQNYPHAVSS